MTTLTNRLRTIRELPLEHRAYLEQQGRIRGLPGDPMWALKKDVAILKLCLSLHLIELTLMDEGLVIAWKNNEGKAVKETIPMTVRFNRYEHPVVD